MFYFMSLLPTGDSIRDVRVRVYNACVGLFELGQA